jgi:hypothetical protein
MKDWIEANYPRKLSYDQLRVEMKDAWEAISSEEPQIKFGAKISIVSVVSELGWN